MKVRSRGVSCALSRPATRSEINQEPASDISFRPVSSAYPDPSAGEHLLNAQVCQGLLGNVVHLSDGTLAVNQTISTFVYRIQTSKVT